MNLTLLDWSGFTATTILAMASAVIALAAVLLTRRNLFETNRPVVSAFVDEESGGEGLTIFNLHLRNTGTRPATEIQLSATESELEKLFATATKEDRRKSIKQVFSPDGLLAVLHADEEIKTSFGLAAVDDDQAWLEYGQDIRVCLRYRDLNGRRYKSKVLLRIRPRQGFGGGVWKSAD